MRDVFVGLLFAIGLFLYSYRGYEKADERAGNLACCFAIGVALFPSTSQTRWVHQAHLVFAGSLFPTLLYFSLVLFTKTDPARPPTDAKTKRNRVYVACGALAGGGEHAAAIVFPRASQLVLGVHDEGPGARDGLADGASGEEESATAAAAGRTTESPAPSTAA